MSSVTGVSPASTQARPSAPRKKEVLPRIGNESYPYHAVKNLLDFALHGDDLDRDRVVRMCDQAIVHLPASVCLPVRWIPLAEERLKDTPVRTTALIDDAGSTEEKLRETKKAVDAGADEIDMAVDLTSLKKGEYAAVKREIHAVVEAAQGREVKVTLQTPLLSPEEIRAACRLSEEAGARFVKTDTGRGPREATLDDVMIMRDACGIGIELASAISSISQCRAFLKLIGPGRPVRFETGLKLAKEEEEEFEGEFQEQDKKLKSALFTEKGMRAFHEAEAYKEKLVGRIKKAHEKGVPVVYLSVPVRSNEMMSEEQNRVSRTQLIKDCQSVEAEYIDPFSAERELGFLNDPDMDPILVQELLMDPESGVWPRVLQECDAIVHDPEWKYSLGARTEHLLAFKHGIPEWDRKNRPELRK